MIKLVVFTNLRSLIAVNFSIPYLYKNQGSYSQYGEDLIIVKLFNSNYKGFYIDIGAHHPFRYSNTQLLFEKGWTGINIDPAPKVKQLFDRVRRRDINLTVAVSKAVGKGKLYLFSDSAFDTLSKYFAEKVNESGQSKLMGTQTVAVLTLKEIFSKYAKRKQIDLLNIDTEGTELEVLQSNNWKVFKPRVICVENFRNKAGITSFLKPKGYKLKRQLDLSGIYTLQ